MSQGSFELESPFAPAGDQPAAIDEIQRGLEAGDPHQVLLGVTGSGKTLTVALDTRLIMRGLRNTERVLTNDGVERLLQKERDLGADLKFEDILPEVAGVYPKVMQSGELEAGAWSCGMVAGLIHDVPSVAELIERIMSEAEELITKRLAGIQAA